MKSLFTTLIIFLSFGFIVAQGFNYQSVVRSSTGTPVSSTRVFLRFTILSDLTTRTVLYRETQQPTTDNLGWISVNVGTGTAASGIYASIDWTSKRYLEVECSSSATASYSSIGTSLINNPIFSASSNSPGPKGDTGATGPQGATGPKGDKGDTGATGPQGAIGSTGAKGDKGDTGIMGLPGAKGDKGDTGLTGAIGSQGLTGATGAKGDKGDKGDTGLIGLTGATGSQGLAGATGATGAKGDKGDIGLMGLPGAKGDKGDTGLTGATGPQSAAGPQGLPGVKGDKGDIGPKGDKGDPGSSANAWLLTGNGGTNPLNNFIGTTDASELRFKVNNNEQLRLTSTLAEFAGNLFVKNKIETPGSIKVGNFDPIGEAGKIRFNNATNDFEGHNGSIWKSFTSTGGLTLPYNSNYGGVTNPAFRINVQNNNTGIEVNNIALAGATEPAIRATSNGTSTVEIESFTTSKFGGALTVTNDLPSFPGILGFFGVQSDSAVALSISGRNNALAVNSSSTGTNSGAIISNQGQGSGLSINQANPTSTQNALQITSSSKGSAVKIEIPSSQNPPTNALEIKNGFIKIDQTGGARSAFKHLTAATNISGNATLLSFSDQKASDIVLITRGLPFIGANISFYTWFDPTVSAWKISRDDAQQMPINWNFSVLVIKTQ